MSLGCTAAAAHAEQSWFAFEAGIGGSAYAQAADGLWLQEGFPHTVKLTAPAIEAGITGDLYQTSHWGIAYHVDYAWLGAIHSDGHATSDANYNLATKTERVAMPLANFSGSGHDMGFLATIEPHYDYAGWRFGIEGGPYFHKPTWTVDATNQVNYIGQAPYHTHFVDDEGWHLGYVLGASVAYKRFSLRYQYFANGSKTGNPIPVIWTHTHVVTANYAF
ncbi:MULTISPECIES: hypothetical protein [unclassified Paraburkholderia]|uniref:hypothetical protein n=1 Tax=unclassified Paraburkholderia TaxID=2615204 RepID=UPI001611AAD3|nr:MULTISPECIES: hypothetical protein [unclassified Paraburkholderia]MBB5444663.1 hypothetical protein [Paraburkholderia sp. WSM4177]MBB5485488.1 hypothetical protein [Paraburkholderia sp. WSM4180]